MTQHSQQFSFPVISKADIIRHYYSKENLRMHNNDTSPALSHVLYNIFSDINRIYTAMAIWLYIWQIWQYKHKYKYGNAHILHARCTKEGDRNSSTVHHNDLIIK